jgi:uncharacterized protein YbcI
MANQAVAEEGVRSALDQISREIVQIHANFYGRGPNRAKTIWQRDVVACILEDIFTNTEALLIARGHFGEARSSASSSRTMSNRCSGQRSRTRPGGRF